MVVLLAEIVGFFLALIGPRGRTAVAWILAVVAFDVVRLRRTLVMKNLARVYGANASPQVCAEVGRASVANFILTTLEFLSAHRVFPKHTVTFRNPERMSDALSRGRGVYLMAIHMGNFELMGSSIGRNFAKVHAPVKPIGKGSFAQWVKRRRERNGIVEIVNERGHATSRSARLLESLRANEVVGFMVDQRRAKGLLVPFFGEPAWTNTGLIYLWKQQAAPIVPVTINRRGPNASEIIFHDEFVIESQPAWSHEQVVLENTKRMNAIVEQMIVSNPKEYFWMHDRWRK